MDYPFGAEEVYAEAKIELQTLIKESSCINSESLVCLKIVYRFILSEKRKRVKRIWKRKDDLSKR